MLVDAGLAVPNSPPLLVDAAGVVSYGGIWRFCLGVYGPCAGEPTNPRWRLDLASIGSEDTFAKHICARPTRKSRETAAQSSPQTCARCVTTGRSVAVCLAASVLTIAPSRRAGNDLASILFACCRRGAYRGPPTSQHQLVTTYDTDWDRNYQRDDRLMSPDLRIDWNDLSAHDFERGRPEWVRRRRRPGNGPLWTALPDVSGRARAAARAAAPMQPAPCRSPQLPMLVTPRGPGGRACSVVKSSARVPGRSAPVLVRYLEARVLVRAVQTRIASSRATSAAIARTSSNPSLVPRRPPPVARQAASSVNRTVRGPVRPGAAPHRRAEGPGRADRPQRA